ncbi:2,3,4,5-tetrahydropyridine-2,6-dicarboxylate N-succinyltransferase [Alphaproteobacteria bacterium]
MSLKISDAQLVVERTWLQLQQGYNIDKGEIIAILSSIMISLDQGNLVVCEMKNEQWEVQEWLKKAILLYMKFASSQLTEHCNGRAFDKISLKFDNWAENDFSIRKIRVVPGAIVRLSAYIAPHCIIMPSFINLGAYIDTNTLIDSCVTIGSCVRIGKNCHIGAGTTIGGVLEPIQAIPVIIEDDVFIGANSAIVEGIWVGKGAVVAPGVCVSNSTKIYNRCTGELTRGKIPQYSVVVPGSVTDAHGTHSLYAAVIVKTADAKTRASTAINELLR